MAKASKAKYTEKQKRRARHVEEGCEVRGVPEEDAERRAWATVNKIHGGGKKSGAEAENGQTASRRAKAAVKTATNRPHWIGSNPLKPKTPTPRDRVRDSPFDRGSKWAIPVYTAMAR